MTSAIGISQGHGGTQVYNLSKSKTLPEFMAEAIKENKSLRKNKDFKERIEVIQGFEFSTSCSKVAISPDGRYIGAIGVYPPDLKVYDTGDLSMKFQRRLDCEGIDFLFLTDDYKKLVLLENDRFLEFHNQGGRHHRIRIPTHGRKIAYNPLEAELLITASDIYRLDLSEGRFKESLNSSHESPSVCQHSRSTIFVGGDSPVIELFDTRAGINPIQKIPSSPAGTTSLSILPERSLIAAGQSDGVVRIYDSRQTDRHALYEKNHNIDAAIRDLHFLKLKNDIDSSEVCIASCDSWQIKVWRPTSDHIENYATFESSGKINSICPYPESGLLFIAQDYSRVGVHFIPALGLAPRWSPFIDEIVENVDQRNLYGDFEDFDFITKNEMINLNAQENVKSYQHGFLISKTLHQRLLEQKNILSQQKLDQYNRSSHLEKLDKKNPFNLKQIFEEEKREEPEILDRQRSKRRIKAAKSIIQDDRFNQFFQ